MSGSMEIPHFGLVRQYSNLKDELLTATDLALRSGQLVGGKFTSNFEEWLRNRTGAKYAVTVHSGTQALEIIARYAKDDFAAAKGSHPPKIQIPNLTYPATLAAFLTAGWEVELVDTDKYGIGMLTPGGTWASPRGYSHYGCSVGLYGKAPPSVQGMRIVDGAQHWLVADKEIGVGMAISFDPTKNLPSSGNGGAIVTNDKDLHAYALAYRNNGNFVGAYIDIASSNSKMSEQDCAQILVRTKYIDAWQARRADIAKFWCDRFRDLDIRCLSDVPGPHAHQKFVLYLADRNSLHTELITSGIDSKIHYGYTLGELPIVTNRKIPAPDMMSVSMMLSRGVLSLPMYPELTDDEVEYISIVVRKYLLH